MQKLKKGVPLPVLGIDTAGPADYLDPRSTPDSLNMEIYRNTIRKRIGTAALGSSLSERVMAIRQLQIGTFIYLVRTGLTKVEVLNQTTSTWSSIANAPLTGAIGDRFDFAFPNISGSKVMVFTNGYDNIRKFTGSGNDANLGGSPPKAKFCMAYGSYLVLANIIDGGDNFYTRVQWSDTGDPETWTGGNTGSVDLLEDDQDITGLGVFADYITVHKDGAIYIGSTVPSSEVFVFNRKSTGVGTVSHNTIQNLPTGEQCFLSRQGVHLFNGITAPLIQSPVMDEMRETMNPEYLYKSWSVLVRELDEYWVGVPVGDQEEPETVYKFNYRTGRFYKDSRTGICAVSSFERTNQLTWDDKTNTWDSDTTRWNDVIYLELSPTILFGDTSGNTTRRTPIYNDNATAISSYWVSKDFTIADISQDEMGRLVRWTAMQVWCKGNAVDIDYSTDEGATWTSITTATLSADYPTDSAPLYAYFDVVSSQIRFRFSNDTAGESFTLKKFIIEAIPREMRH